ncbi:MAG: pyrroline-5-carboxylate reductase [Steroidobacteraceae bacterium]
MKLGFIGGGNMARALISALLRQGFARDDLSVGEPLEAAREALRRDFDIRVEAGNEAAARADVVVLAVKPQEMRGVLLALRPTLSQHRPLLLSIAAGIRSEDLMAWCPGLHAVRAMPNRPALFGAGATGLFAGAGVSAEERHAAEQVLGAAGSTVWMRNEAELDVVTALSGSGPAYFLLLAEQMAAAAVKLGLEESTARQLAAQTLYGTGLIAHHDPDLAAQRAAVTSRGGTTAAAIASFEQNGLGALVEQALAAAARRSAELAVTASAAATNKSHAT